MDEENQNTVAVPAEAGSEVSVVKKSRSAAKANKASPRAPKTAAREPAIRKLRRYNADEKATMILAIDADLRDGAMLKDAVAKVGISDQTYYQWKKAAKASAEPEAQQVNNSPALEDLPELAELEAENVRLRTLLAQKLKDENAELRRRLGLK
ncbi:transcriptional regulator [Metarhizobium album]|uniref:Transcriptional regulator n=1 Tax=Metarhizobium album TaxID=2182425 RepID=A0A2U2DK47_9HYPH|nr:transposase [Rhizobium album]PWE53663.1 transcriptional regulator [Rhizobium album]